MYVTASAVVDTQNNYTCALSLTTCSVAFDYSILCRAGFVILFAIVPLRSCDVTLLQLYTYRLVFVMWILFKLTRPLDCGKSLYSMTYHRDVEVLSRTIMGQREREQLERSKR